MLTGLRLRVGHGGRRTKEPEFPPPAVCGRIVWRFDRALRAWFRETVADAGPEVAPLVERDRFNIAPTDLVVAVTAGADGPRAEASSWGFPGPSGPVFNARAETAAASPLWAPHWGRHNAVVPASGFYEWTGGGAARTPFYVHRTDGAPLVLAALVGGPPDAPVASILTCAPNRFMAGLHDRMPVVLEPEDAATWLRAAPGWEALARPAAEVLEGHAVDRRVGDPRAEGPGLVEPVRAWF